MVAIREDQARSRSSARMGASVCLARQQPTTISIAIASDFSRNSVLWDFGSACRYFATGLYSLLNLDLAGRRCAAMRDHPKANREHPNAKPGHRTVALSIAVEAPLATWSTIAMISCTISPRAAPVAPLSKYPTAAQDLPSWRRPDPQTPNRPDLTLTLPRMRNVACRLGPCLEEQQCRKN